MTDRQVAVLWWRQLFSELGNSADIGTPGRFGQLAKERHKALVELFFSLLIELPIGSLIEVGAHNAEASKRFVDAKPAACAVAYEAAPVVYERVLAQGLPERLTMHNCAIGSTLGSVKFFVPRNPHLHLWASTLKRTGNVDTQELAVPMISLDEAGRRIPPPTGQRDLAVWIDAEGSALDVLGSGESLLEQRVAVVYVEVNDTSVYEGAATSLDIITLFLTHGFIPVARDNEFGDAWNLLAVHGDAYYAARETIAKWFYSYSTSARSGVDSGSLPDISALQFQTICDAVSRRPLSFNEIGIPILLPDSYPVARGVLVSGRYGPKGALVALPQVKICRADRTGVLIADRQHVMRHEIFELVPAGSGEFHLMSTWGHFVRLGPDGTFDATSDIGKTVARFTVKDLIPNLAEIQQLIRLPSLCNLIN